MQSKLVSSDFPLLPVDRSQAVVGGVRSTVAFRHDHEDKHGFSTRPKRYSALRTGLPALAGECRGVRSGCHSTPFHRSTCCGLRSEATATSLGLVNQLSLLLGGLAALIYVVFLESYYRQSVTRRGQKPQAGGDAAAHTPAPPSGRISQWLNTARVDGFAAAFCDDDCHSARLGGRVPCGGRSRLARFA